MRKLRGYAIFVMAALVAVFMAAGCACENDECRGGGGAYALHRPTVIFVTPLNTVTGVPINRKVTATFSEAMDSPDTISTATFTVAGPGGVLVGGTVTYDATNHIAIFTPTINLLPLTTYIATITMGAQNLFGVSLARPFVWIFTTGATADSTSPKVTITYPVNVASLVPLNSAVTATFSEAMDPTTIIAPNTFTLMNGTTTAAGTVTYVGLIATFKPSGNLLANTTYTAEISTAATDLADNALAAGLVPNPWTFTTGTAPDTTRPTVISVFPANGATNVPINTNISALFSEAMDPTIIDVRTATIVPSVDGMGTYDVLTHIATFLPNSPLAANTTYTVTITTWPMDLAGNHLLNNYVWSFKTAATLDTARPWVSLTNPADLASLVPVIKSVTATFNEEMKLTTITDDNFTLVGPGGTVDGIVSYNVLTKVATFNPLADLDFDTDYTATITTGAQDLAGNTLVEPVPPVVPPVVLPWVPNPWTFTTVLAATTVSPLPIDLGAAENFVLLSGSGISSVPISAITGDIGVSPGSGSLITGLTCPEVTGTIYTVTAAGPACRVIDPAGLTAAKAALTVAYGDAAGRAPDATISGDQGGVTWPPGVYKSTSSLSIASGDLTLDAQGDANAVWIFQIASTLTTVGCGAAVPPGCGTGGNVRLINSADAANVYWQVGTFATIGDHTVFEGNILANISISINTGSQITGRLLSGAQPSGAGAVTLISDTVVMP